jgi:AcrR family transcriptional regulator
MQLFWRRGYEATSISDLTAAMGINPPSLYSAFGDKERLFLEAVERYQSAHAGSMTCVFETEVSARNAIAHLLESVATDATRPDTPPGCMVITAATNCSASAAHIQAALADYRAKTVTNIRARLDRAVAEGELSATTDTASLARFYATVIQGMTIQARDGVTREELLAVGAAAMQAWPAR